MSESVRIAMWSGPRNISTAMMRAWEARTDCAVTDEPFYGAYLATTGLNHPMRLRIMRAHPINWQRVAFDCANDDRAPIVFQKHMSQHMVPEAPLDWMGACRHAFLIRPPGEVAASFKDRWDGMSVEDLGFRRQAELFDHVCQLTGNAPPVLESRQVLNDPPGALRRLCASLRVPWDPAMLSWAPGRRATDGVWAEHWYKAVEGSTGFAPPAPARPVPDELRAIADACLPYYEALAAYRISAD